MAAPPPSPGAPHVAALRSTHRPQATDPGAPGDLTRGPAGQSPRAGDHPRRDVARPGAAPPLALVPPPRPARLAARLGMVVVCRAAMATLGHRTRCRSRGAAVVRRTGAPR